MSEKPQTKRSLSFKTIVDIFAVIASLATIIGLVISLVGSKEALASSEEIVSVLIEQRDLMATSVVSDGDQVNLQATLISINQTLASSNIATAQIATRIPTFTIEPSFTPSTIPSITSSPLPTFTPTDFMSPTPSVVIPIGESHFDTYNQIELIIDSVAILPDNSMQWNFSFWNRYTRDVGIGFSNQVTYLADESGTRYSALNDDAGNGPLGNSHWVVQPGERQRHWIIFSPRQGNAKTFTVGMGVPNCYYACWKVFTTTVNFP